MENLSEKSLSELKDYAQANNIDITGARSKSKILAVILGLDADSSKLASDEGVVKGPEPVKRTPTSSSFSNEKNVVGSRAAERRSEPKKDMPTPKNEDNKVALLSEKNMHWQGVGHLKKGYNILNKEVAEKWLTKNAVREATAKEVAAHYGKL
jgi:hypothetical protein